MIPTAAPTVNPQHTLVLSSYAVKNIVEAGERGPARPHSDQGIACQGGDLDQDVEVEGITSGGDAQQACKQKDIEGVEGTQTVGVGFLHNRPGAQQIEKGHRGHGHEHQAV